MNDSPAVRDEIIYFYVMSGCCSLCRSCMLWCEEHAVSKQPVAAWVLTHDGSPGLFINLLLPFSEMVSEMPSHQFGFHRRFCHHLINRIEVAGISWGIQDPTEPVLSVSEDKRGSSEAACSLCPGLEENRLTIKCEAGAKSYLFVFSLQGFGAERKIRQAGVID